MVLRPPTPPVKQLAVTLEVLFGRDFGAAGGELLGQVAAAPFVIADPARAEIQPPATCFDAPPSRNLLSLLDVYDFRYCIKRSS